MERDVILKFRFAHAPRIVLVEELRARVARIPERREVAGIQGVRPRGERRFE